MHILINVEKIEDLTDPMHGIICSFLAIFFSDKPMLDVQVGAILVALKLETEIYAII